jgi:hypothetical protein
MLGNDGGLFGIGTRIVLGAIGLAAAGAAIDAAPVRAGSRGDCITLEVRAPLRMPGGAFHPPGTLTLCDSKRLSPVSSIHKAYIDGHPVAMLASHTIHSESGTDDRPVVMFSRDAQGRLELMGYVLPGKDGGVTHLLNEGRKPVRRTTAAGSTSASSAVVAPTPTTEGSQASVALVAARTP